MPLGCDCATDRRIYLYVGRAVQLRNRLQVHAFGNRFHDPSPWIEEFLSDPHNHQVYASAWYMPKNELLVAEASLIDLLKPIRNKKDMGYSPANPWSYRLPDADGIEIESLEPDRRHTRNIARNSPVRHEPAAYAWWVDPGADLHAAYTLLKHLNRRPFSEEEQVVRRRIAEWLSCHRRAVSAPSLLLH
jgi:hypothetical protein